MKIVKNSDVLLINVPLDRTIKYREEPSTLSSMPPLGQLYIATYLQKQGYRVSFIDLAVELFKMNQFVEAILKSNPKIVGFATYVESWKIQNILVEKIKEILPDTVIIGGGHCATFEYSKMLDLGFDYLIRGEGEIAFLEICDLKIKNKKMDASTISGLVYKENGTLQINEIHRIKDLDALPYPNRSFLNLTRYSYPFTISTARGCPGRCIFCSSHAFWGNEVVMRSASNIYHEVVELYKQYFMKEFFIVDDTFTVMPKRTKEFCNLITIFQKEHNLIFSWGCESRVDIVNKELLDAMQEAGCTMIQFGMESGNDEILKSIKKRVTYDQIYNAVALANECGIKTNVSIMIGHHEDTSNTIEETLAKAKSLQDEFDANIIFSINTPYPGTELRENLGTYGAKLLISDNSKLRVDRPSMKIRNVEVNKLRQYYDMAERIFRTGR